MNQREICVLAVRLLAVWALVEAATSFQLMGMSLYALFSALTAAHFASAATVLLVLLPTAAQIAMGVVLWRFSTVIGSRIAQSLRQEATASSLSPSDWLPLGVTVIGLLTLISTLREILRQLAFEVVNTPYQPGRSQFSIWLTSFCVELLMMAFALWLTLRPRAVMTLLDRMSARLPKWFGPGDRLAQ